MDVNLDKKINGYSFNDQLTEEILLKANFRKIDSENRDNYYYHCIHLDKEITLNIKISEEVLLNKNISSLDIIQNIDILDENFLQIYTCFYDSANNHFKFLDKIINAYNNKMNGLVKLGVLCKEEKSQQELLKSK